MITKHICKDFTQMWYTRHDKMITIYFLLKDIIYGKIWIYNTSLQLMKIFMFGLLNDVALCEMLLYAP